MDLVNAAVGVVDVIAEEKHQIFRISGDPGILVRADRLFLRQAIVNVLHNAVKYSPTASAIEVSISPSRQPVEDKAWVSLEIADHGPGIGEEHRSKVFDRFYRIDQGRSRDAGGVGSWARDCKVGSRAARRPHRPYQRSATGGCCFSIRLLQSQV